MVNDENVGKQDLQGLLFGWNGIYCEVELLAFVLVWALSCESGWLVNSHLHLAHTTFPSSWN